MKLEHFPDTASAVIDPRLPDLRRLLAHTKSAYIFTPTPGTDQDEVGCEIDLALDSVQIIHPMVDLRCSGERVLSLVREAPGARKSTQPQPSGQIRGPSGPLDIYVLSHPVELPDGWLDAVLIAPVTWAAAERKFELIEGAPKLIEGETDALPAPVAEALQGEMVGNTPLNDALILGEFTTEQNTWMSTAEVEVMQGGMYGARHSRNTQDGAWNSKPMSLIEFTGAITKHPAAKTKYGTCIVLGSSIEGARKAKAMDKMSFLGLDIDSCSIPDDHIDPRRSALFMARSVLREARDGDRTC